MRKEEGKPTKLCVYVYPKQYERLCELSNLACRSQSSIIRMMLDGVPIRAMPSADYYDMAAQLRAIGINLNQLAFIANATGNINRALYQTHADELQAAIMRIREAVELA